MRQTGSGESAALRLGKCVILDAAEESIIRLGKRHKGGIEHEIVPNDPGSARPTPRNMVSFAPDAAAAAGSDAPSAADSMFESFRWLEAGEDLDLRLLLDDGRFPLGEGNVSTQAKKIPYSKRRLSMAKLPFAGRTSTTLSRPASKDASATWSFMVPPNPSSAPALPPPQGHVRRRSRALSLITPIKHSLPNSAAFVDSAAAHYQDPDARMKLRVYLASPHKFDEAVEFGFPSIDEVESKGFLEHKRPVPPKAGATGLVELQPCEEKKGLMLGGEASTAEMASPGTPEAAAAEDDAPRARPTDQHDDAETMTTTARVEYAQAPVACREMTLRMTLTRPDLRANEEQMYGWQKTPSGRKSSVTKDEPQSPTSLVRNGHSKESIERQFAALDQEDLLASENGVMRRFWNRMRRS